MPRLRGAPRNGRPPSRAPERLGRPGREAQLTGPLGGHQQPRPQGSAAGRRRRWASRPLGWRAQGVAAAAESGRRGGGTHRRRWPWTPAGPPAQLAAGRWRPAGPRFAPAAHAGRVRVTGQAQQRGPGAARAAPWGVACSTANSAQPPLARPATCRRHALVRWPHARRPHLAEDLLLDLGHALQVQGVRAVGGAAQHRAAGGRLAGRHGAEGTRAAADAPGVGHHTQGHGRTHDGCHGSRTVCQHGTECLRRGSRA